MKKAFNYIVLFIAGVSIAALASGCMLTCVHGSGHQVTESRKVGNFTKLDISGGFKIVLKQDSSLSLNITADDNLLKYVKTNVDDGVLHIYTKKNFCNSGQMVLNIGIRQLEEIKGSGAIEVVADGKITTKDIAFRTSGASKITLDLDAANVTTEGSGASEMFLTGQASSHHVEISGVGKIHAFDFVVGNYYISTSGAGECQINVLHSLEVHSSGASDVKYKGNPSSVTNDKSGASSVNKVD
jgi:hypothetical protein